MNRQAVIEKSRAQPKRGKTQCALLLSLLLCWAAPAAFAIELTVRGQKSSSDASHDYYRQLLHLVLSKQTLIKNWQLKEYQPYLSQERALHLVKINQLLDIDWAGTSIIREDTLQAIRIPLTKGLLGFRVSLVHSDNLAQLNRVENLTQLKTLIACQGAQWPDTDILQHAGLSLITNARYDGLFKQLIAKRCQLFPRGVAEASAEFNASRETYPELRLYQDLIIHYPFAMYFFVSQTRPLLALALTQGLEAAIDDGSFDDHMKSHAATRHLFPLKRWLNARYIKLENPLLPEDTNSLNPRYWIQPPRQ